MTIWGMDRAEIEKHKLFQPTGMAAYLGVEILDIGDDYLKARMPVDERTRQPFGRLHGGASVALAETAASVAANLTLDLSANVAVGLEINANHIRPVMSGYVYAIAKPEALGRTTQVWTVRITDEQDRLICVSRCTLAIISAQAQ